MCASRALSSTAANGRSVSPTSVRETSSTMIPEYRGVARDDGEQPG
jgi:hypothetical protein